MATVHDVEVAKNEISHEEDCKSPSNIFISPTKTDVITGTASLLVSGIDSSLLT